MQRFSRFYRSLSSSPNATRIVSAATATVSSEKVVEVEFSDGYKTAFHTTWLADHVPASFHPSSKQRGLDSSTLELNVELKDVQVGNDGFSLSVESKNLGFMEFPTDFLKKHDYSHVRSMFPDRDYIPSFKNFMQGLSQKPWNSEFEAPAYKFGSLIEGSKSEVEQKRLLSDLDTHGAIIVENMPDSSHASISGSYYDTRYGNKNTENLMQTNTVQNQAIVTETVVRQLFGCPRETFYGRMWDTAPKIDDSNDNKAPTQVINDTAYTKDALDVHTDCCYLFDMPGLQVFNCVAQSDMDTSGTQGCTRLVDCLKVMQQLAENEPETFNFFCNTPLKWFSVEEGIEMTASSIPIQFNTSNENNSSKFSFRYNTYDLAMIDFLPSDKIHSFYKHNKIISKYMRNPENIKLLRLTPGQMLVINNQRIGHGRESFTGFRNMVGCYVGKDDWLSKVRVLEA